MYGLIGQIRALPGRRAELAQILSGMASVMPGCHSYVVAEDLADEDVLWVTEVWADAAHHRASLELPQVQEAIAAGRSVIAGFGHRFETRPLSGIDGRSLKPECPKPECLMPAEICHTPFVPCRHDHERRGGSDADRL